MKNIIFIISLISILLLSSCDDNELKTYDGSKQTLVGFTSKTGEIKVDTDAANNAEFEVAVSDLSSSDRTVEITINTDFSTALPENYSLPSTTVIIPANSYVGYFTLTGIDDDNIDFAGSNVVIDLISIEGGNITDEFKRMVIKIVEVCPITNQCTLTINFDGYSEEESWDVVDQFGVTIASNSYDAGVSFTEEEVCIPDGTYTFTIYDAYGDGLYDGSVSGTYELKFGDTIFASGGGNYGSSESTTFTK